MMATQRGATVSTEAEILSRMIHPERDDLSDEAAQALLRLKFDRTDLGRMHELAVKNQDDVSTPVEKLELESHLRVSCFIDLMHAKAGSSLKGRA